MSKPHDGGPAFPSHAGDPEMTDPRNRISCGGMTLRDWFAGRALPAIIEADGIQFASNVTAHAMLAYEQADAMLKAREATP